MCTFISVHHFTGFLHFYALLIFVTGLLRFYQLLTLAYFVLGCIFAPRLHETLSKGGPMQLVIVLLTISTCLQATGTFIMMIHLAR